MDGYAPTLPPMTPVPSPTYVSEIGTPAPEVLPATGTDLTGVWIAAALILAGGLVLLFGRRRRP